MTPIPAQRSPATLLHDLGKRCAEQGLALVAARDALEAGRPDVALAVLNRWAAPGRDREEGL